MQQAAGGINEEAGSPAARPPAPAAIAYRTLLPLGALLLVTAAVYANHFRNGFHFDDFHTVTGNLAIRSLANIPRFFADPSTFSTLPTHQVGIAR